MKTLQLSIIILLGAFNGFGDPKMPIDRSVLSRDRLFHFTQPTSPLPLEGVQMSWDVKGILEGVGAPASVFLVTEDGTYLGPIRCFMTETGTGVLVDSLPVLNAILREWTSPPEGRTDVNLVEAAIGYVFRQVIAEGESTGLVMLAQNRTRLLELIESRMPRDRFEILKKKLAELTVAVETDTWTASWTEVDRLGGAERVVAHGTMRPLSVRRVEREVLLEAGEIPKEILNLRSLRALEE